MKDSILRKLYAIGDPNYAYAIAVLLVVVASYTVGMHGGMETMRNESITVSEINQEFEELPEEMTENTSDESMPVGDGVAEQNMDTMLFWIMPSIRLGLDHALAFESVERARRWLSLVQAATTILVGTYVVGVVVRFRYDA